jgi:hypothetical protein
MTCVHLHKLYQLCEENSVKLSSSDLIHIVCMKCGRQEVCPSTLTDEYEARKDAPIRDAPQPANNA